MVASTVLPLLYEFLVAESRYEVRGSEYRARLRTLFEEMLSAQLHFPPFALGSWRQVSFKLLEDVVNSVGFADCEDVRTFALAASPSIRQYAYPEIPAFCDLDARFLKSWRHFFGIPEKRDRTGTGARARRARVEEVSAGSPTSSASSEEESSSDSDFLSLCEHMDVLITVDDILCPRMPLDDRDLPASLSACPPSGDPGAVKDPSLLRWRRQLPIYMDSSYKIDHGSIVFGVLSDSHLSYEWSCNSAYDGYESMLRQLASSCPTPRGSHTPKYQHSCDGSARVSHGQHAASDFRGEGGPPADPAAIPAPRRNLMEVDNTTSIGTGLATEAAGNCPRDQVVKEAVTNDMDEDEGTFDEDDYDDEDYVDEGGSDDESEETEVTASEEECGPEDGLAPYDPKFIYGNYYCALPRGHPRSLGTLEDMKPSIAGERSSAEYNTFTPVAMSVTSTVVVGPDGIPQVTCVGTLGERDQSYNHPRLKKYQNGQVTLQNRVKEATSSIFAIKNAVSADCTACSGWSLNNGISVTFCEFCEERLLEDYDPSVLTRLFDLRSFLISDLYPSIGYRFIGSEGEDRNSGRACTTHVTVRALYEAGGVYPRAAQRDGRYMPNTTDIPIGPLRELTSIVLTNAELCAYTDTNSRILPLCFERRQRRMRSFNEYLELLCRLHETKKAHRHYSVIETEFNQVFAKGMLPFMSDGVDTRRQYFDEVTSSLLCRLPLDAGLLKSLFLRRGVYKNRAGGSRTSTLLALTDPGGGRGRGSGGSRTYRWHVMALKYWNRKSSSADQSPKQPAAKSPPPRSRPASYMEFATSLGALDYFPKALVEKLKDTGRLLIGFPTSLQMHVADVPDAVFDPLLYSRCGMGLGFTMPTLVQNLSVLSLYMELWDHPEGRNKRRAREGTVGKPVQ
ncbi:ATP-dependent DNA helicase PIF1 [Babesia caballi]|uniref:ATP-dependent DNA helicase PIF1 n=1 Tax=Babesia caballi TaxID=5871 RepID=A0AAV4LU72_BABCB|nr:ATP-dependent DNA helicase PIF1 [Babesia caballi]